MKNVKPSYRANNPNKQTLDDSVTLRSRLNQIFVTLNLEVNGLEEKNVVSAENYKLKIKSITEDWDD